MNNDRISEIRARLEAATLGPWKHAIDVGKKYYIAPPSYGVRDFCYLSGGFDREHDAAFIAHSREDIPFLLDQIAALTAERDRLTEAQRWIPVTERLPEVGKCVLVRQTYHAFIGDHGEYEGITVGYLHQPTDKRCMPYFYYAAVSDYGDKVRAESICPGQEFVTHWMPLPAAPEEGAEAALEVCFMSNEIEKAIEHFHHGITHVVHGWWQVMTEYATKTKYGCSECGRTIMASSDNPNEKFPYCHCGARMDG